MTILKKTVCPEAEDSSELLVAGSTCFSPSSHWIAHSEAEAVDPMRDELAAYADVDTDGDDVDDGGSAWRVGPESGSASKA